MKMTLTTLQGGRVVIEYDDLYEDRITREFYCGVDTSYVHEQLPNGQSRQVCEFLSSQGSTLRASRDTLAAVIRREYKRMKARNDREIAADRW